MLFFDYFDKCLIVLSVKSSSISIASFATIIGTPVGTAKASFSLEFSISTCIVKRLLKTTRNKKKKHDKIVMLARSELNSIQSKISEALINSDLSIECGLTLKRVCDMIRTYSQMHRTDKYSQHSSII